MFTSLLKKISSPGHLAFLGLLATAVGVTAIVWPGVTIGVVVALFASPLAASAGARVFVAGSAIFCAKDGITAAMQHLMRAATGAA